MKGERARRLPSRWLPLCYFAFAHLCLVAACAAVALDPRSLAGFFYHPRILSVVHLLTLGWISGSILGALHLVAPLALRAPLPVRKLDYWMFALFVLGASGVPSHFWIDEYSGIGGSGLLVTLVFLQVGWKTLRVLRGAPVPAAVKLHFLLAFANAAVAAAAGMLLGLNKWIPFLPGRALTHAYAHAHLAGLGFATLMVFGAGYRLLPMLLPSAMPAGRAVAAGALLLEAGVLGVFVTLVLDGRGLGLWALVAAAGVVVFLANVGWMLRHRKPPPKARRRPDFAVLQALQALVYLALATLLGLALAFSPTTAASLRLVWVYGVCALVGFLAQIVVGVEHRLVPLFAWLTATAASGWKEVPPSPHSLPDRRIQALIASLWTAAVPALAAGFAFDHVATIRLGGSLLLAAAVAGAASNLVVLRAAGRARPAAE